MSEEEFDHRCEIHLRVHSPRAFTAWYTYRRDRAITCKFPLLCEVAESLQKDFKKILRKRGLHQVGVNQTDDRPYVQDLLSPVDGKAGDRWRSLMPGMIPKYVRCYDDGGVSCDRYTVALTGKSATMRGGGGRPDQYPYLAMSDRPFHPQGFGQREHSNYHAVDVSRSGWAPPIGRKNLLGTRIPFEELPEDCQRLVIEDYLTIWKL